MLQLTVKRHDRYQIELKVAYPVPGGARKQSHEFDLYLFAPLNLGVRRENYSKDQFYRDLQSYLRLTTPVVPLERFVRGPESPSAKLRAVIEGAKLEQCEEPPSDYERAVRLYCSILKSAVRESSAVIRRTTEVEERDRLVGAFVKELQEIGRDYREMRALVDRPGVPARSLEIYLFGDEWLSLMVEDSGFRILEEIRTEGLSGTPFAALRRLADGESRYRAQQGYPSVSEEDGDNELPVYRRSVLKKYMAGILFLQTEVRRAGAVVRETLFGIAAALAMVFATAVAFATQSIYGALTPAFFVALVVSYIFKDRLKEALRSYFQKRMRGFLFDQRTILRDAADMPVGECRTSFDFIDRKRLPDDVRVLRDSHHITEIENRWLGEQIMVYRKRVQLNGKALTATFPDYDAPGVTDILRLRVNEFLSRMDDPTRELFVADDEGYQRIKGVRVYHLNLIVRLHGRDQGRLQRFRIVLTREGIKRIEPVQL